MPTTHYFEKFPIINYNNYNAVDIISNAKLVDRFLNNPYVYYPYELSNDQRPDVLSSQYYDDPYYSWLIYYGNKIVDPYHDWNLPDDDFLNYIRGKYGSVEIAQKKVAFYRTNWYSDDRQITPSVFDNTILPSQKKYWERKFNEDVGILLYYYRKPYDITVNTNRIVKYTTVNIGTFTSGDLVDIRRNSQNIGTAEILNVTNNTVTFKNLYLVEGDLQVGDILRHDTNTSITATLVSHINTRINIPIDEFSYWEPVSYFDYENELNTSKKTIKLIDNRLSLTLSEALSDAMSEDLT